MNIHFITGFFLGICCSLLLYIIVKIIKAKNKEAQNILYQNMTEQMQCHFENISNKLLCNISQNFFQQNQDILKNFSLQFREKIDDFQNQISKNVQLEHESAKNFSQQSRENFELFFSQFREKIENFQKIAEKNFQIELENFMTFDNNIKNFIDAGNKIAKDTNSIVVTLKSDNRTQGIWGEIVLERVLESSGLRKNEEYILQKSTPTGRPDAIILLPEKRCVMIDAKTSLSSFSAYLSATTDQEKQKALQSFQESTQSHIAKLTAREYSIYEDYTVAEYVLMFIPIESCYSFFFCDNNKLWDLAWKNKIMPVWLGNDIVGNHRTITSSVELFQTGKRLTGLMEVAAVQLIGLRPHQRTVRLTGIDARLAVHHPGLTEQAAGIKFEVEAHLAQKEVGHGLIQIDSHKDAITLRFHTYLIYNLIVRIDHRIEARQVARGVGKAERRHNGTALYLALQLFGHGLPLTGRRLHTDITVTGHTVTVDQDTPPTLMPLRIDVAERHHVGTAGSIVTTFIQLKVLCRHCRSHQHEYKQNPYSHDNH